VNNPKGSGGMKEKVNDHDDSSILTVWVKQALLQGWLSIAAWMTFGLLLEGFLGYKIPTYLQDQQRRELFRLAHTHGTFSGLLLLIAALATQRFSLAPPRTAQLALRIGTVLMPLGFLIAGIWHYEGDPGLAIWLVPPAALMIIFGAVALAFAARTSRGPL
jgi:hypothetical protein